MFTSAKIKFGLKAGTHIPTRLLGDASDPIVGDYVVGDISMGVTHTLTN